MVGGRRGGESEAGTVVFGSDFATAISLGVALITFGAGFKSIFGLNGLATVGERVAVFAGRAVGELGRGGAGVDAIAGGGVNDFAGGTSAILLIDVSAAGVMA